MSRLKTVPVAGIECHAKSIPDTAAPDQRFQQSAARLQKKY
jgi:hypothetical protein